jgi:protein TonB
MEVADILRDRTQQPGGLQRMLTLSMAVHATLAAAIIFAPGGLLQSKRNPPVVMTISIGGGGVGPENGGMTTMGGRPIQQVKPPDEPPKREAVRAPAATAPEMTMPLPKARTTKAQPAPAVKQSPDDGPHSRTPTRGDKITPGSTPADTGVRGQGFGLSTGGGPGAGSSLEITGDFCCPEYLATMITRIRSAWNQDQGARGTSLIRFTINRDGTITNATIFKPSGVTTLDTAALRAVLATRTLPPLPDAFPNPTLTMRLSFEYQ